MEEDKKIHLDPNKSNHHPPTTTQKTRRFYNRQFSVNSTKATTAVNNVKKNQQGRRQEESSRDKKKKTKKPEKTEIQPIINKNPVIHNGNHQNQLILIFKNVTQPYKGIFQKLQNLGAISIQFHPHNRFCIVEFETPMMATDSLTELRDQGYSTHRRSEMMASEWKSLLAPLPKVPEEYSPFYRHHYYIFDPKFGSLPADQQMREFLKQVDMTAVDYAHAFLVVDQLQKILPFGKLHPFGSILTRIGDKNYSDVDVLFEDFEKRAIPTVFQDIKRAIDSSGPGPGDGKCGDQKFGEIDQILDDEEKIRVPLLRLFVNGDSNNGHGLKFDISCGNVLGVQNSKLIHFLLSLDPLIRPLSTFIRQWARCHCLKSHTNGLKNYAILLLVLVFCFRKKILPTVHQLQSPQLLDPTQKPMLVPGIPAQDGEVWNVGFCDDPVKVKKFMTNNGIGIDRKKFFYRPTQVLGRALEFFEMMQTIRPCQDVVSALTGEFVDVAKFLPGNEQKLPPSQSRYILNVEKTKKMLGNKNTCLYLQDPFDLSFNVTATCSHFIFKRFLLASRSTLNMIRLSSSSPQKLLTLPPFFTPLATSPTKKDHRKQLFKILKSEAALNVSSRLTTFANEFGQFPYDAHVAHGPHSTVPVKSLSSPISLVMEVDERVSQLFMTHLLTRHDDETQYGHLGQELLTRFWYRALVQFFGGSGPPLDSIMGHQLVDRTGLRHVTTEKVKSDEEDETPSPGKNGKMSNKNKKVVTIVWLENLLKGNPPCHHKISFEFTIDLPNLDHDDDDDMNNFLNFSSTIEYALIDQKDGEKLVNLPRVTVIIRPIQLPFSNNKENNHFISPIKMAELVYGMNCSFQNHFTHFVSKELHDLIHQSTTNDNSSHSNRKEEGQAQNQKKKPSRRPKEQSRGVKNNKKLDKSSSVIKRNN